MSHTKAIVFLKRSDNWRVRCNTGLKSVVGYRHHVMVFKTVSVFNFSLIMLYLYSKAVPLPPCMSQGERRYSSYSFLNWAIDGGEWSASRRGRVFTSGKNPQNPLCRGLGGPQSWCWTQRLEEKSFDSTGNRNPVVQSVVRHYTDWADLIISCLKLLLYKMHRGLFQNVSGYCLCA
jgi:hypothetical protein